MRTPRFGILRSRPAVFIVVTGVLLLLFFGPSCRPQKGVKARLPGMVSSLSSNVHITLTRQAVPMAVASTRSGAEGSSAKLETTTAKKPSVIFAVHVDLPPETNPPSAAKAPFGRLLQCQLVNTLESLAPNTPIIGLVVEDLWFNGRLLVPAGSEIHGQAQLDRTRERIMSGESWHIVFQSGEEIKISGIALDREFEANGAGWGMTDGSAGIRGDVLRNGSLDEVKLFIATALSGLGQGMRQTQSTPFGSQVTATAGNAGLAAASAVMNQYAERILEAIKRDGLFVRVPAGKQFYVYLTEPLKRDGSAAEKSKPR